MQEIQDIIQPLYESGDLLGFSICDDRGSVVYNESFFDDDFATKATMPFIQILGGMQKAKREVERLTVELDDIILIYRYLEEGHTLFALSPDCNLDQTSILLPS